jgi:hypothetical protein
MSHHFLVFFLVFSWVFAGAPSAFAQNGEVVAESQVLGNLQGIREQLAKLKTEIDLKTGMVTRPDPRSVDFKGYQAAFAGYRGRIDDLYRKLTGCYDQISRVYRTNPNSPNYKPMVALYLQVKAEYDGVAAMFGTISPPEKLQNVAVVSADKRLNSRIASTFKTNPTPAPENPKDILASDESRFIGTFDAVEMFLLIKADKACYVFFGWRDEEAGENGAKNAYHLSVLRSEFFPKGSLGVELKPEQHLEQALKLNLYSLDSQGEVLADINQFLSRVKSYSRTN